MFCPQPEEEPEVLSQEELLKQEIIDLKQENVFLKNEVQNPKLKLQNCEKKSYNYVNISIDKKLK